MFLIIFSEVKTADSKQSKKSKKKKKKGKDPDLVGLALEHAKKGAPVVSTKEKTQSNHVTGK